MDTETVSQSLKKLKKEGQLRQMPRGMLDRIAPDIYEAVKDGASLNQVRLHLENDLQLKVSVRSLALCLRRNKLVPERSGRNTHNVCHVVKRAD